MARPIVVFDLDGTLVDTAPDLIATLNVILASQGIAPLAYDDARNLIGGGVRPMLEGAVQKQGLSLSSSDMDALFARYLERYAARIAELSRPFPGVEEALDELAGHGFALAVCTNKLEWLSVRLLDALGLTSRFTAICGQDTFAFKKPHPEALRLTIAAADGDVARAVMVGDSITDIRVAKAAEIPVVAVDFGYTDQPVATLGPDRVISGYDRLPATVFGLLSWGTRADADSRR
jgi:phosphoglycolate phosphatase